MHKGFQMCPASLDHAWLDPFESLRLTVSVVREPCFGGGRESMRQHLHPANWSGREGRRKASPNMRRAIWELYRVLRDCLDGG